MTVILKEESITLYKDKNTFTAVVFNPGSYTAFGQVAVCDFTNVFRLCIILLPVYCWEVMSVYNDDDDDDDNNNRFI